MTDPLAPDPFTPERVADLVERVKIVDARHSGELSRRACRYAMRSGVSCAVAAKKFGVDRSCVQRMWHRLYPGVPIRKNQRSRS